MITPLPTPAPVWSRSTGVVIIGSGAAGMAAALHLVRAGVPVTMITKHHVGDGSSAWAQGGLAAVLDAADSFDAHVADTLVAGAGLSHRSAVTELITAAPTAIERLIDLGAAFDRDATGALALGLEGGHGARRIVHAGGDASGAEVCRVLGEAVGRAAACGRLQVTEGFYAVDAITDDTGAVTGLVAIDDHGRWGRISATAVVLATGGAGRLWADTTNPVSATGDGLAVALRAGAAIRDVEFLQFHPTMLVVPESHRRPGDRGVLISEAVRGEGARLVDRTGAAVMAGIDPRGDLAPRDVVAAAMQRHLLDHDQPELYLDARHLGEVGWRHHFPSILMMCRTRGVDPVTTPIPVRPAAHYHCGGVLADLDGRTDVPGLYAIGEVASTGVHGANRLASNSLTEALVAGDRLGGLLATTLGRELDPAPAAVDLAPGPVDVPVADDERLRTVMSRYAGVLRDASGLLEATAAFEGDHDQVTTVTDRGHVEAINQATVARAVLRAATLRTESRGCHRRRDHDQQQAPEHQVITLAADGSFAVTRQPAEQIHDESEQAA